MLCRCTYIRAVITTTTTTVTVLVAVSAMANGSWSVCCFRLSGSHADQLTDSEVEEMAPDDGQMNDVTLESEHLEGPVLALDHRHGNTLILTDARHKHTDVRICISPLHT